MLWDGEINSGIECRKIVVEIERDERLLPHTTLGKPIRKANDDLRCVKAWIMLHPVDHIDRRTHARGSIIGPGWHLTPRAWSK
mmetsp:Transcript_2978/g.6240  ORF Transcript_2978/g.6240 Transcript_2978/m.6240 type:complete len:83 (-) Transcript_2978:67-315(-)